MTVSRQANSRVVISNQAGVHPRLEQTVRRHLATPFQKPIAEHTRQAFEHAQAWLDDKQQLEPRKLILDSCCGIGQSTRNLAEQHPDAWVIGVDKSAHRLARHAADSTESTGSAGAAEQGANYLLLQADLNDFWRLAVEARWQLAYHYLLYPNPWPKSAHLQRRWHGAPVFPALLALGGQLELRSNWKLYLEEFAQALALAGRDCQLVSWHPGERALTPFEAKYHASGQPLWRLVSNTVSGPGTL